MHEREITGGELLVAGRETPEVLQFADPVFDLMPPPIQPAGARGRPAAIFARRDHALDPVLRQLLAQRIGVVGAVGGEPHHRAGCLRLGVNRSEAVQIVPFAATECQADGGMLVGAGDMQLRC